MLFEERHFAWPELPGDPDKEEGLPWFWFTDVGEARTFLGLFWLVIAFWLVFTLNSWIFKSMTLNLVLIGPAALVWFAYVRVWNVLCKRARAPLNWLESFMPTWLNPRVRHCLQMAYELVSERE